jgi:quinol monooxygenase YgiN
MDCAVYTNQGEAQTILYLEQWQSRESLDRHIRSELYFRVLSAMELATEAPEIYFHEVSDTRGLEYVEALRTASPANQ